MSAEILRKGVPYFMGDIYDFPGLKRPVVQRPILIRNKPTGRGGYPHKWKQGRFGRIGTWDGFGDVDSYDSVAVGARDNEGFVQYYFSLL